MTDEKYPWRSTFFDALDTVANWWSRFINRAIVCRVRGHDAAEDHCNLPKHRHCWRCLHHMPDATTARRFGYDQRRIYLALFRPLERWSFNATYRSAHPGGHRPHEHGGEG